MKAVRWPCVKNLCPSYPQATIHFQAIGNVARKRPALDADTMQASR